MYFFFKVDLILIQHHLEGHKLSLRYAIWKSFKRLLWGVDERHENFWAQNLAPGMCSRKVSLIIILIQERDTGPVLELRAIMPITSLSAFLISILHSDSGACMFDLKEYVTRLGCGEYILFSSWVEMGCTTQLNLQVYSLCWSYEHNF